MIALFLPSLRGGGAERMMLNLARGLAERGLAVDLVLAKAEGPYLNQVPSEVRVIDLGAHRVLVSLPGLVRYLRRKRPAVLLSTLPHANIVALWARRLSRTSTGVVVRASNTLSRVAQNAALIKVRLFPFLVRYFYPLADGIVAVSQGVAEDLIRITGLPPNRIQVIYNPVVTHELLERAKEPVDHPWFDPGKPPVIIGVGRLARQKDFPNLIRAFALVRRHRPARLTILGKGKERPSLDALVHELDLADDVALPGFVDNPYAYMSCAAVFVLSSIWEGLPNALIEAMACGAPAVSTDCPSGPREIIAHEVSGLLVPPANAEALSAAILKVLRDKELAQCLSKNGQARAEDFHVEKIVRQYEELFLQAARNKSHTDGVPWQG